MVISFPHMYPSGQVVCHQTAMMGKRRNDNHSFLGRNRPYFRSRPKARALGRLRRPCAARWLDRYALSAAPDPPDGVCVELCRDRRAARALRRRDGGFAGPGSQAGPAGGRTEDARGRHGCRRGRLSNSWRKLYPRHTGGRADPRRIWIEHPTPDRVEPRCRCVSRAALARRAWHLQFCRRSRQNGAAGGHRRSDCRVVLAFGGGSRRHRRVIGRRCHSASAMECRSRGREAHRYPSSEERSPTRNQRRGAHQPASHRLCAAPVYRRNRQCDADGFSHLSAVPPARKGCRASGNRRRADTDLCRRCRRQARLRLSRGASGSADDCAYHRRGHSGGHPGSSSADDRCRLGAVADYRCGAERHFIRALRHCP